MLDDDTKDSRLAKHYKKGKAFVEKHMASGHNYYSMSQITEIEIDSNVNDDGIQAVIFALEKIQALKGRKSKSKL